MGQPLRVESKKRVSLGTTKTQNNLLWFVNNRALTQAILGYLAMYVIKYGAEIYAFVIQGNHYHLLIRFPNLNRAAFFRDFNARVAMLVKIHVKEFPGGHLFGRRYSEQIIPEQEDMEDRLCYCYLQAVNTGLAEIPSQYPDYNSFNDATKGIVKKYKVIDWETYNQKKRYNPDLKVEDYTTYYDLKYSRLPGYEEMPQLDYRKLMVTKAEAYRQKILERRKAEGKTAFLGPNKLKKTVPGTAPLTSKTSKRGDYRPLVLTKFPHIHAQVLTEHETKYYYPYKAASKAYLSGDKNAIFPPCTYKPPGPFVAA